MHNWALSASTRDPEAPTCNHSTRYRIRDSLARISEVMAGNACA